MICDLWIIYGSRAIAILHSRRTTQRWTHAVGYQQQNVCIADQIVKILNDRLDKIIYVM